MNTNHSQSDIIWYNLSINRSSHWQVIKNKNADQSEMKNKDKGHVIYTGRIK